MKKFISVLTMLCFVFMITFSLTGCGDTKRISLKDPKTGEVTSNVYDTYGFFNKNSKENPNIQYEIILGNVIWACILSGSIIFPVYFIGFSLYEPVGPKIHDPAEKGVIK